MKKAKRSRSYPPSRASLREIPEVDFKKAKVSRNSYAQRIADSGLSIRVGRGRPKKGLETGPTMPRSVRFPVEVWNHLEQRARAEGIPLHAALRAAVAAWVNSRSSSGSKSRRAT